MSTAAQALGFIGLGVMGEPICRNLALKSGARVYACDRDPAPLARLATQGVLAASSASAVAEQADIVFLSLPSGEIVAELARATDGLLAAARRGLVVVDLGTSPVELTRQLAQEFASRGASFVDAPVARTRAAAEAGTLSVMVGADVKTYDRLRPLLDMFASDVTHCGPVGCGQVVKILNNMVLFETVVALSEAHAIGTRSGVDPKLLFETLAKGSADSFALRNHGMKAILPGIFPERAFSTEYARKDLSYALRLAQESAVDASGARNADSWLRKAVEAGDGDLYFPVISRLIGRKH
ncbi:MAG: NAD(P)-dependent oxidoreductase [Burkholderiales bacterium]|nr:NAD(P)-dependent oxidoreductase [Burkholderiales bacterium]